MANRFMEGSGMVGRWERNSCGRRAAGAQRREEVRELGALPREEERRRVDEREERGTGRDARDGPHLEAVERQARRERRNRGGHEEAQERGPVLEPQHGRPGKERDARERKQALAVDRDDTPQRGALE